ncbi:ABC transporter permease [Pelomicrobium sp.]|jgi:putative ABC transport system permease protein|uniref:ABC transporter permease n=1 Tax=Pelomicrobium sp. TaxID=2815319 RepID=UPI002FDE43D7
MKIYQIAWREISRRRLRTLYTASSIVLSIALLVATVLVGAAGQKDLLLTITRYGHSLTIFPATSAEVSLQRFGIGSGHYIPEEAIPEIKRVYDHAIRAGWEKKGGLVLDGGTIGGVDNFQEAIFAPRLYEESTLLGRRVVVAGLVPDAEYKARFWWEVDDGRLINGGSEVMVGKVFADVTGVKVGDRLEVNGRPMKIVGVLRETDSPDDYMVFGDLGAIQQAFGKQGLVSLINVRAMCNYCPVGEAELAINQQVVGVRATSQREIATAQHKIFRNVTGVILGLVFLSLVIACMAVFNMVLGTIHNRLREVGLLKVLGASRGQLLRLFMYEALLVGVVGGIIGYAAGYLLAVIVGPWLLPSALIETRWWHPLAAVFVATLTSVVATLYPALHASRIRAVEAFGAL